MKRLPIIALDYTAWEGNWMNRQHLLSRLGARGWPIIYSNGAVYYNNLNKTRFMSNTIIRDNITIFNAGYIYPRNYKFTFVDQLVIKHHCSQLKKSLSITKNDKFISFCFHPDFFPYVDALNSTYTMFHIYDVYQKLLSSKNVTKNIEQLINRSNIITAASEHMWDQVVGDKKQKNIIHNGVDYSMYESVLNITNGLIKTIKQIPKPRIGYVGAINRKIDFELIYNLACRLSNFNFIFVGNILHGQILLDPISEKYYAKCSELSNVYFLGPVSREFVPHILQLMDVNTLIYTKNDNDWVQAGYPIKINEYLASGKPVVTSYMPILEKYFKDNISICTSIDEWVDAFNYSINGNGIGTVESRKRMAKNNNWENRVNDLESLMFSMITR